MLYQFGRRGTDEQLKRANNLSPVTSDVMAWGLEWARTLVEQGGSTEAWVAYVDSDNTLHWTASWPANLEKPSFTSQAVESVIRLQKPLIFDDHYELTSWALFPLLDQDRIIGIIGLLSNQTDYFKPGTVSSISVLAKIMSNQLVRRQSEQMKQDAEHTINRLLHSSLDVRDPLPVILTILADVLAADGVICLGSNPLTGRLALLATHGLGSSALAKLNLYFETGLAGKMMNERQPIWIENLRTINQGPRLINLLSEEGYSGYLALPLIGHNDLLGLLKIVWREPQPQQIWDMDFLQRMAEQISFTMERTSILRDLRHRNEELVSTYNAMIEGLSRALELRDLETDGHTRRVSTLTMRLVEHMQIPADQWDSIKQGALLHDIGKLGIPDAILLKPGSLTAQERKVMQQHPLYGYNILAPIISLRHALDIPLYHHERWDGSGYPYGLKGEQIPIFARLFAVVDVFDALTSDRPYRSAWTHTQAVEYVRAQAGQQFDSHIVELFLEIADQAG